MKHSLVKRYVHIFVCEHCGKYSVEDSEDCKFHEDFVCCMNPVITALCPFNGDSNKCDAFMNGHGTDFLLACCPNER